MAEEEKLAAEANAEAEPESPDLEASGTETVAGAGVEPEPAVEGEDLEMLLEDARNKADELWNELLRGRAELENIRKRAQRDVESAHKFGLEKFALELLPVRDAMELGLAAATGETDDVATLREGMELTHRKLTATLEKFGVVEIDPTGEPFNPEFHQAMSMQQSAEQAPNTVLMVMQKGYLLNDRLLRPAMVVVSKAAEG